MQIDSMPDPRDDSGLRSVAGNRVQCLQGQCGLICWQIAIGLAEDEIILTVNDIHWTSE